MEPVPPSAIPKHLVEIGLYHDYSDEYCKVYVSRRIMHHKKAKWYVKLSKHDEDWAVLELKDMKRVQLH